MHRKKWIKLNKNNDWYELEPELIIDKREVFVRINFTQAAFACDNEHLIAVDSKGTAYYIDLTNMHPCYQKLGTVGQASFIAFNPTDNSEILLGLASADIKLFKIHTHQFCLISGHKIPATNISFYKDYCLTSSHKEVIMWNLKSFNRIHQLHISTKNVSVKKASLSNMGHIVVLYHNDSIQVWMFNQLDVDTKIDVKKFGIRNVKDFVFTQNGRAMVVACTQNKIIVLNTSNWSMMKSLSLPESFIGIKRMSVVPLPLDSGANKIVAVISSNCMLYFLDLNLLRLVNATDTISNIQKIIVSSNGRYILIIEKQGLLRLTFCEKLFPEKPVYVEKFELFPQKPACVEKFEKKPRPQAHSIDEHLRCIRQNIKKELRLDRLLLILKEFGKYPDKHRPLIWSTILQLPANKTAFISIANNVTHKSITLDIFKNYHLADYNKASLLTMIVDYLIQWCPLLAQSSFLPNLVFPFIIVFQKDQLSALELTISILVNYCQKWFEYHPLPPLNILGIIENILLRADPQLLNIFCRRHITSIEYAWPLLQTAMSEVLSGDEWLILWDNLLSFQKPRLFLMCVIAYNIYSRNIIISTLHNTEDLKHYYRTQGHVKAKELLKIAQKLDKDTPYRLHPKRYLRNKLIQLPEEGPYPPLILEDYPQFVIDDLNTSQLLELSEQKENLYRYEQDIALKEEKRLHDATKCFMKKVHKRRLDEVRKCLLAQLRNKELQLNKTTDQTNKEDLDSEASNGSMDSESKVKSNSNEHRDCAKLQRDVAELETEVQHLLDTLKYRG